jgi:hypothetical protein
MKCSRRLKSSACIPSTFIGIRQLPLSRTGKRDRNGLPDLDSCCDNILNSNNSNNNNNIVLLKEYGFTGDIVSKTIIQYLNLQSCQQQMLTTSISFAMLGGDSLSAAVICRTLYANMNEIQNSRWLGGGYGQLPEPFNTPSLLRARNLGEYVDLLDKCGLKIKPTTSNDPSSNNDSSSSSESIKEMVVSSPVEEEDDDDYTNTDKALLYDALLQATTLGQSSISSAILCLKETDPNYGLHNGRIGKTSRKIEQRAIFKATPLHLACFKGDAGLVKLLLRHSANYRSPNTSKFF